MKLVALGVLMSLVTTSALAGDLPDGYMSEKASSAILDKTLHVHLAPDLGSLSDSEKQVVAHLTEVGAILHDLYENMRHREAVDARHELAALDERLGSPKETQNLIALEYMAKGPVIRGLDGQRRAFLPVADRVPGRDVYPWGIEREEVEEYLERYPKDRASLLHLRTVVRRTTPENIAADLAVLDKYPVIDGLHPTLRSTLKSLEGADQKDKSLYAVPYSVAFADGLFRAYEILRLAADLISDDDPEFAGYLRNRARDFLSNDYESGDASWVTGRFKNLNAQIGSYEVYDDELYGVKSFFGMNVLLRDQEKSAELREAIKGMQSFENSLPYEPEGWVGGNKKTVREDIPVGVYHIIADYGQSRGTNTATILPNESEYARKYGRTILLRANIMENDDLFQIRLDSFKAAVKEEFAHHLTAEGGFYRTLWHEVGHYLGVDRTRDGRDLGEALEQSSSTYEELKADLVSLFLVRTLHDTGYYDDAQVQSIYASGIRRTLQKSRPQRSQNYQTMQLMQMNYHLEKGSLKYDKKANRLVIDYDTYHDTVVSMLREVLALQYEGNLEKAEDFIDTYAGWEDNLHGKLAESMRSHERYRYAYVTYEYLTSQTP